MAWWSGKEDEKKCYCHKCKAWPKLTCCETLFITWSRTGWLVRIIPCWASYPPGCGRSDHLWKLLNQESTEPEVIRNHRRRGEWCLKPRSRQTGHLFSLLSCNFCCLNGILSVLDKIFHVRADIKIRVPGKQQQKEFSFSSAILQVKYMFTYTFMAFSLTNTLSHTLEQGFETW